MKSSIGPIWFVINLSSGDNQERKKNIVKAITNRIEQGVIDGKIIQTEYSGHAVYIAQKAVEEKIPIVVGIGGDGTLNEIATALKNSETAMGIIPAGSGNGLARHLRIPFDIEKSLDIIETGHAQFNDIIHVNNKVCVSISGIGFDAEIARVFSNTHRRGLRGYIYYIFKQYFTYKTETYEIQIDDNKPFTQNAFLICCANSNQFGYDFKIAPTARTDDGFIDLVIVSHASIFEMIEKLKQPFKFESFNDYLFLYRRAKKVTVKRKEDGFVNIDGEAEKMGKEITFSIVKNTLKTIVPKPKFKWTSNPLSK